MYRSCYYLFIIEAEKFSATHNRPLFRYGSKNNTGVCIRNDLFTSEGDNLVHITKETV